MTKPKTPRGARRALRRSGQETSTAGTLASIRAELARCMTRLDAALASAKPRRRMHVLARMAGARQYIAQAQSQIAALKVAA